MHSASWCAAAHTGAQQQQAPLSAGVQGAWCVAPGAPGPAAARATHQRCGGVGQPPEQKPLQSASMGRRGTVSWFARHGFDHAVCRHHAAGRQGRPTERGCPGAALCGPRPAPHHANVAPQLGGAEEQRVAPVAHHTDATGQARGQRLRWSRQPAGGWGGVSAAGGKRQSRTLGGGGIIQARLLDPCPTSASKASSGGRGQAPAAAPRFAARQRAPAPSCPQRHGGAARRRWAAGTRQRRQKRRKRRI